MLRATLQEPVPLQVLAADGRTDLFAQAKLFDPAGTPITTISLPHLAEGIYGSTYVPTSEGYFSVRYELFEDSGFTIQAPYDLEAEIVETSTDKTNILRILGLVHDNTVIDQQVYNLDGCLTSARVRQYDTKANTVAAGATGLLNTWTISASYSSGQLVDYKVVREP